MVKITGMKAHKARLGRIRGPEMVKAAGAALKELASAIEVEAANSITTGGGVNSPPSAPGTPPNSKLGGLDRSIRSDKTGELSYEVSATARYAAIQEFGGTVNNPGGQPYFIKDGEFIPVRKDSPAAARLPKTKPHKITLPERPYMRPAAAKVRPEAAERFKKHIKRITAGK